ncbi:MAG: heavy-metal-associated domain-containing protein [Phycisphaerales bacterium]
MTTTLTDTRTLEITGMTSDACIQKVTAALRAVPGITPQTVKLGSATITSDTQAKTDAAIAAIVSAGFKATELDAAKSGSCTSDANAIKTGSCTSGPMAGSCAPDAIKATPIPTSSATTGGAAPYTKSEQPAVAVPAKTLEPVVPGATPARV